MPVYRDKERKSWYVSCIYRDFRGERKHKTKRGFKTKAEAAKWEMEFTAKASMNTHMLFRDFVDYYEQDRRPRLRETTWMTKEYIIKDKLLPFFGDMKLDEIDAGDIVRWQNGLVSYRNSDGEPYAPTYLRTVNNQLSAIFNHAVRYYGLPSSPVAKAGKIGSKKGAEMQFWTRDEYLSFAEEIMDKPESYLAFEILYWTGIRVGELLALTPADFDLEKMTLSVTKSYQRLKRRDVVTPPKTPKSVRVVTMPEFLRDEVAFYLEECSCLEPDERVFDFTKRFVDHEMRRGCEQSGVKRIRIHDLRHSHVSLLIELGFSALAIADRLGHESVDVTYRYAHLFPNKQAAMAQALDGWRKEGEGLV